MAAFVDVYCERTGPGMWAEPWNLLSNAAFLVAALFALRLYRGRGLELRATWDLALLIALLFAIAGGSSLWHALAAPWTRLADELPILLFISVFLPSFLYRAAGQRLFAIIVWLAAFHGANTGLQSQFPRDFLNGSIFYVPTWIAFALIVLYLWRREDAMWRAFAVAWGIFTVSLAFRTADDVVCAWLPVGTHFLWHLLNGALLYVLVAALVERAAAGMRRPGGA